MAEVIFEKRAGKYDAMLSMQDGGWVETPAPKQMPIPHDMFHYAVEQVMGRRGFLARRAAGEGRGFRMTAEATSEAVERLVEAMQADSWSGRPDPDEVIALYHVTCAARGDQPLTVSVEDVHAMRAAIDDLAQRWSDVPIGGRMVLRVEMHGDKR